MNTDIFQHSGYKSYLNEWLKKQPKRGHGLRSKMAEAAGCNTTYVSQVLAGNAHFSSEQGERIAHFIGHTEEETRFCLLLIQYERAGTPSLRAVLEKQIAETREEQFNLKRRLRVKAELSTEDQATYYSQWYYSAIHVAVSVRALQTKEALCAHLDLSPSVAAQTLQFLVSRGLVRIEKGRYMTGQFSLHLGRSSPMISRHHANWRIQAIRSLETPTDRDLHYSSVVTLGKSDVAKLKSILVKAIEGVRKVIATTQEEEVYCYAIDFFGMNRR